MSVLYSSDDAGAPQLTSAPGCLIAILKAVLVTGYGTKLPLGYDLVFEEPSTNRIVFRQKSGTRMFIFVDDPRYGILNTNYIAGVRAYEAMSDINTGYFPCPQFSTNSNYHIIIKTTTTTDTVVRPWRIIGDEFGFYFISAVWATQPYSTNSIDSVTPHRWKINYIGDYIPYNSSNKNNFCMILSTNVVSDGSFGPSAGNETSMFTSRLPNNERGSVNVGLGTNTHYSTVQFGNSVDLDINGNIPYLPISIHSGSVASNSLGILPGILHPIQKIPSLTGDLVATYVNDGVKNIAFKCNCPRGASSTINQQILLVIGDNFRNEY